MNVIIKTNHLSKTSELKDYAQSKIENLNRYFSKIQEIVVELHEEDVANHDISQVAHATLYASGTIMRAEEASHDMHASVDLLFENLKKQLRRYNDKVKDHKGISPRKYVPTSSGTKDKAKEKPQFSEDDLYVKKPLEVEEVARRIDQYGLPFLVFRSFETEKINVAYPIGDGELGIIEP